MVLSRSRIVPAGSFTRISLSVAGSCGDGRLSVTDSIPQPHCSIFNRGDSRIRIQIRQEEPLQVARTSPQKSSAVQHFPKAPPCLSSDVEWRIRREVECQGNRQLRFVQVRDIVDERTRVAGMHETERRRTPQRNDHRVNDTIEAGIRSRERLIHCVAAREITRIVLTF